MFTVMLYGYGSYYVYGYRYYDATYLLVILGLAIGLLASGLVKSSMKKYSKIRNQANLTGADAARRILQSEGITDVAVVKLAAEDGDHYDPANRTVCLSAGNFDSPSVTAVAVAAHECGHAIQHASGYTLLSFRSSLVPAVNIGSRLSIPLILIGVILSFNQTLIMIGIAAFALTVLFHLVTLPVEIDASRRALVKMENCGLVTGEEKKGCRKVLTAAAFTYVASALAAVLQLARLLLLYGGGNSRRRN